jgi:hypothetical protein
MAQAPVCQHVFTLEDGDVVITFPVNISRRCVEDLKAHNWICSLKGFAGPPRPSASRICAGSLNWPPMKLVSGRSELPNLAPGPSPAPAVMRAGMAPAAHRLR